MALLGALLPSAVRAADVSFTKGTDYRLELERVITVGGIPDSIVVDCSEGRNDVLFYDSQSSEVKFLNGDMLELTPEELYLPHRDSTPGWAMTET